MTKLPIYIDLDTLDTYAEYLLNYSNKSITFSNLSNLRDYISRMDEEKFNQNDSKVARYLFIKYFLDAKLSKGVTNIKLIYRHIEDHTTKDQWDRIKREVIDSLDHNNMTKADV